MADAARQVPEKYGPVRSVHRPRLGSYGRRLRGCVGPALLVAGILLVLWWRRPAAGIAVPLLAVALLAGAACWSRLGPALVVRTSSHVLRSRPVGFAATALADLDRVVTVGALHREDGHPRARGRPYLWGADRSGRRVLELDGAVWDARTLEEVAAALGAPRTHVEHATVGEAAQRWPRLVPWRLRHPRLRSAAASAGLLLALALVVVLPLAVEASG
jgi:hypothetical protein